MALDEFFAKKRKFYEHFKNSHFSRLKGFFFEGMLNYCWVLEGYGWRMSWNSVHLKSCSKIVISNILLRRHEFYMKSSQVNFFKQTMRKFESF